MDPPPSDLESRTALVKSVWDQCWEEFQSWKEQFASDEIAAAAVGKSTKVKQEQDSQPDVALLTIDGVNVGLDGESARVALSSSSEVLTVWCFPSPADGESGDALPISHRIPVYPCGPSNDIPKPVAPYESCVPLTQSVEVINTAAELELLEFIPFGNEPRFLQEHPGVLQDEEDGSKVFRFKWELPDRDPDLDVVVCEAARRLHTNHKLSFSDIDATGILPRSLVMEYGIIWDPLTTRTMLPWPPRSLLNQNSHSTPSESTLSTEQRLSRMSNLMCANLSCIQPACPVHGLGPQPPPRRERPSLTIMIEACGKPCGAACFQNHDKPLSDEALWSDTELHELGDVWESWNAASGLSVCMLARMVFKPCWEVFQKLHNIKGPFDMLDAPDDSPDESPQGKKKSKRSQPGKKQNKKKKLDFSGHTRENVYEFTLPCNHTGPCEPGFNCICYQKAHRCKRNCPCDKKCTRRWKGCSCLGRAGACWGRDCECQNNRRECDPELCRACGAKNGAPCKNVAMRLGRKKRTRVVMKDYEWGPGWGLELAESAEAEEFIDEYVGEVIGEIEFDFRGVEAVYLGRNYMFSVDKNRCIDSARASNETRFINHAKGEKENVTTEARFVDEEPRIGFFAARRIEAGEELFFNYGDGFFVHSGEDADASTSTKNK